MMMTWLWNATFSRVQIKIQKIKKIKMNSAGVSRALPSLLHVVLASCFYFIFCIFISVSVLLTTCNNLLINCLAFFVTTGVGLQSYIRLLILYLVNLIVFISNFIVFYKRKIFAALCTNWLFTYLKYTRDNTTFMKFPLFSYFIHSF